jgi:DNA-binding transcriptional LysR family regulator
VYCAANHRLARRKSLTLNELAQERWAAAVSAAGAFGPLLSLRQAFEERGLPAPRVTLVSDLVMFRLRAVAGSDLVGIATKENLRSVATQYRLKILPVKGLVDWIRPVAVAYRKDAYLSPAARRFIEILKTTHRASTRP